MTSKDTIKKPKRRLINRKECLHDLHPYLIRLFPAIEKAIERYNSLIRLTPPEARLRGYEALTLNCKIAEAIQEEFPHDWKFSRYRRFALVLENYIIFFKKLDKNDMPMNIHSINDSLIKNQFQGNLFADDPDCINPIAFFGYKVNRWRQITDLKLVYIDDGKVRWQITRDDLLNLIPIPKPDSHRPVIPSPEITLRPTAKTAEK